MVQFLIQFCQFSVFNILLINSYKYIEIVNVRKRVMSPPASLNLWSHLLFLNQRRRPQQRCHHHHYQCYFSYFAVMLKLISGYYDCKIEDTWPTTWKNGRHFTIPDDTHCMDTSPYPVVRTSWTLDNSRACGFLQLTHNCAWSDVIQHFFLLEMSFVLVL